MIFIYDNEFDQENHDCEKTGVPGKFPFPRQGNDFSEIQ